MKHTTALVAFFPLPPKTDFSVSKSATLTMSAVPSVLSDLEWHRMNRFISELNL